MMLQCWQHNPKHRPTFGMILEHLSPDLTAEFHSRAYYMNPLEEETAAAGVTADDVEDMELIHSKTPLHPSSSSQHHAFDKRKSIESLSLSLIESVNNERHVEQDNIAGRSIGNALPCRPTVTPVSTQSLELEERGDLNVAHSVGVQSVKVAPIEARAMINSSDAIPLQSNSKPNGCISGTNTIDKDTPYSASLSGKNGLVKGCHNSLETSLTRT